MAFKPKRKGGTESLSFVEEGVRRFKTLLLDSKRKRTQAFSFGCIAVVVVMIYLLKSLVMQKTMSDLQLPPTHGHYTDEIVSLQPLIFPPIEHAPRLKQLNLRKLHTLRIDVDGNKKYVLKESDKSTTSKKRKEITDEFEIVKRDYLDHGKRVFSKGSDSPEVVVVTLVDFDQHDTDTLIRVVQNRVDYAQRHRYGVYVRWAQEFIPTIDNQDMAESYEFLKPLMMRAAMHAFPKAKYFWFLDQHALIMRMDLSLQTQLLDRKIMNLAVLKNVPVVKGSNIKTYNHLVSERAEVIIPQTNDGKLDTNSFIVKAGLYGKAFMDYLGDPLVRDYSWPSLSASVGHALQWHPNFLAKSALVVPKTIASVYDPTKPATEKASIDVFHYMQGDFVALFDGCQERKSCASDLALFYSQVQK
ncbi:LAME_0G03796g1_1 [Lachancea meyersii CBS 8951]|uniref:LAME_0G03796g1_1 n=1 Tax=Lachancea meyersii CBS 8951 TaxID=1266667 RepID=A0A1G4K6R6_9SACH|nr:LAME_0G03796g1_1 [Lachancea meyersii CBS 8951]